MQANIGIQFSISYFTEAMDLSKGKVQQLILAAIITLGVTAEKFRQLAPADAHSRTRTERFQYLNCFDMKYGTAACAVKGAMKTHLFSKYDFENKGPSPQSSFLAKYNTGAIFAFGSDFIETVYFGGAIEEGLSRGAGAFSAAYIGGIIGAQWLGRFLEEVQNAKRWGFIAGSKIGSWFGGRTGLMAYDLVQLLSKQCKCVCSGIPASNHHRLL